MTLHRTNLITGRTMTGLREVKVDKREAAEIETVSAKWVRSGCALCDVRIMCSVLFSHIKVLQTATKVYRINH